VLRVHGKDGRTTTRFFRVVVLADKLLCRKPRMKQLNSAQRCLIKIKKRKGVLFYGRFLTSKARIAPTIKIETIMAMPKGKMYWSANEGSLVIGCVVGVAAGSMTSKIVSWYDGQYPFVPPKAAMTL
jgi:hypothetical protein